MRALSRRLRLLGSITALLPSESLFRYISYSCLHLTCEATGGAEAKLKRSCTFLSSGSCDTSTRSSIFRYAQRKFVLFQEVTTAYAVQWQALQVEDTVLLAVAQLTVGVKLFQYDGWRFLAAPTQLHEGRFGPGVTGLAAARWNGTYVLGERQDRAMRGRDRFCWWWGGE